MEIEDILEISKQAEEELDRRRIVEDEEILDWGKFYFPDKFTLPFADHHKYFADTAYDPFTDELAPRGTAKTTVRCFLIPAFTAMEKPDMFKHFLNIQATSAKALAINSSLKIEFEENERLRRDYGNMVCEQKWTEKQFVLKSGVIFSAIGAGESMRGINWRNVRPDYIIVDDLYDEEDYNNVDLIKKKNTWWLRAAYPARSKTNKSCSIHILGTAVHDTDIYHLLAKKKSVKFKKFQAITDEVRREVLWPELNSYSELMAEKEMLGSIIFNREYQNECRDDLTSIIKELWIKYAVNIPEGKTLTLCGVDPSVGKKKKTGDFTGIVIAKVWKKEGVIYWYIIYAKALKLTMNERVELLKKLHINYHFDRVLVEGIAGFADFVSELKRSTNLPIKEISAVKDKITNLELNSSKFENGKVIIIKEIKDSQGKVLNRSIALPEEDRMELEYQLTNNMPAHDDVRDALLLILNEQKIGGGLHIGIIG